MANLDPFAQEAARQGAAGGQQANAALSVLLQQLMNGGTQEMQRQLAERLSEVNRVRAQAARYSPEAALADAQGLINQTLRQAMEKSIPSITRAAEGAGASANSMRALLTQDALAKAAESASAQGIQAVQGYGGIAAQLSGVLEGLTRQDNSGIEAIINTIRLMQEASNASQQSSGGGGRNTGGYQPVGNNNGYNQAATDAWFNRPGGILSNAQQSRQTPFVSYGPAVSDADIATTISKGLGPTQSLFDVPGINTLYNDRITF